MVNRTSLAGCEACKPRACPLPTQGMRSATPRVTGRRASAFTRTSRLPADSALFNFMLFCSQIPGHAPLRFHIKRLVLASVFILGLLGASPRSTSASPIAGGSESSAPVAHVTTDKHDYHPGDFVLIKGDVLTRWRAVFSFSDAFKNAHRSDC